MPPSPTNSVKEDYQEEIDMGQSCQKSDAISIGSKGESTNCPSPTNSTSTTGKENYKESASSKTPDTTFDSSAVASVNNESILQEQGQGQEQGRSRTGPASKVPHKPAGHICPAVEHSGLQPEALLDTPAYLLLGFPHTSSTELL